MGPLTRILSGLACARRAALVRAGRHAPLVQATVLRDLLARARHTQWGRQYGYADIRTPEQYRARVPVTPYEAAAHWWHRAFEGERDVAWPGHVRYFALSSGTTAGNKMIPVTAHAIRSNRRAGAILAAVLMGRGGAGNLLAGRFLYLGGSTTLRPRGACLVGDASGIMARHIPFYVRRRHLPEPDIAAIVNWEEKIDRVVDRYLTADVAALGACPSWAAMLFRRMRQAADARGLGERTIGQLWPRLSHFVSYGMAFEPYRQSFDAYIGRQIHYVDTYSSSEAGMSAVQEQDAGPLTLIVDNGVFYEFVPADQADAADPARLHLGEVRQGVDYAVLVSTNGGIWAYPLGDVVRFVCLSPPRLVFAGRTHMNLSAFGEHVDLRLLEQAVADACQTAGALVADYTVWAVFPSVENPVPVHRWIVEFDRPPADPAAFMAAIDRHIRQANEDYDAHRTDNYGLRPPELVAVPRSTFYAWMKAKGKLGAQHKVPRVARSAEMAEELLTIARTLAP